MFCTSKVSRVRVFVVVGAKWLSVYGAGVQILGTDSGEGSLGEGGGTGELIYPELVGHLGLK